MRHARGVKGPIVFDARGNIVPSHRRRSLAELDRGLSQIEAEHSRGAVSPTRSPSVLPRLERAEAQLDQVARELSDEDLGAVVRASRLAAFGRALGGR